MSETVEQIEATWASADRALLETAIAALPTQGVAASPIVTMEWNGEVSYVARISSTKGPVALPKGIRTEAAPVAGVFMQGPQKPTPLQWMDRLAPDRQVALLEALNATPQGRLFALRLTAAREIDPKHPDTMAGVGMLRAAKVLADDEAAALLA
jgi:hypothetical protein